MKQMENELSAEERRAGIAAILARGVLRLRRCNLPDSRAVRTPEETVEKLSYSLEEGAKEGPHAPDLKGGKCRRKGA